MLRRILGSGTALVALVVLLIVGSLVTPQFALNVGELSASSVREVKAGDLQLVCPGGAYRTGGSSGTALGVFDQAGSAELNASGWLRDATLSTTGLEGPSDSQPLPAQVGLPDRIARPSLIAVTDPSGQIEQGSTLINASQLQLQNADNFSGLLAAGCQQPGTELWLVGGDTSVGREALLVVTNPGRVDAQIDVTAYATGGELSTAGLTGLSVAAGKTLVLQLASDLMNQPTIALRVNATGGSVAAWIQQRVMRGTIPGGSDFIAPATELGKSLVISGLLLRGNADAVEIAKTRPEYADQSPMLRVFVPRVNDANGIARRVTVTAQIFGASAKTFGTVLRQTVTSGTTTDMAITGIADGDYVAYVTADLPVRAAIRLPRTNKTKSPATDFAWLQAGASLEGTRAFRVPQSGVTKISIANPSKTEATFAIGTQSQITAGTAPTITLAAGQARTLGTTAGAVVWLRTDSKTLRANLVVDLESAVASLPITDYKNLPAKVWVSVR